MIEPPAAVPDYINEIAGIVNGGGDNGAPSSFLALPRLSFAWLGEGVERPGSFNGYRMLL